MEPQRTANDSWVNRNLAVGGLNGVVQHIFLKYEFEKQRHTNKISYNNNNNNNNNFNNNNYYY